MRSGLHAERASAIRATLQPDLVVGSDVTYEPAGRRRLVQLLATLACPLVCPERRGGRGATTAAAEVLLAYKVRFESDGQHLRRLAADHGFARCEVVHVEPGATRGAGWDGSNDLEVMRITA